MFLSTAPPITGQVVCSTDSELTLELVEGLTLVFASFFLQPAIPATTNKTAINKTTVFIFVFMFYPSGSHKNYSLIITKTVFL